MVINLHLGISLPVLLEIERVLNVNVGVYLIRTACT